MASSVSFGSTLTSLSSPSSSLIPRIYPQEITPPSSLLKEAQESYGITCRQLQASREQLETLQRNYLSATNVLNDLEERITKHKSVLDPLEKTHHVALKNIEQQTESLRNNYINSLGNDISNSLESLENFRNSLQILDEAKKKILADKTVQKIKQLLEPLTLHATSLKTEIGGINSQINDINKKINSLLPVKDLYKSIIDSETIQSNNNSLSSSGGYHSPAPTIRKETLERKESITQLITPSASSFVQTSSSSSSPIIFSEIQAVSADSERDSFSESSPTVSSGEYFAEADDEDDVKLPEVVPMALATSSSSSNFSSAAITIENILTLSKEERIEKLRSLINRVTNEDLRLIIIYNNSLTNWTDDAVLLLSENTTSYLHSYPDETSKKEFLYKRIRQLRNRQKKGPLNFGLNYSSITLISKKENGKKVHISSKEEMEINHRIASAYNKVMKTLKAKSKLGWTTLFLKEFPKESDSETLLNRIRTLRANASKHSGVLYKGTPYEIELAPGITKKCTSRSINDPVILQKTEELKNIIKKDMPTDLKIFLVYKYIAPLHRDWTKVALIFCPDKKTRSLTNLIQRLKKKEGTKGLIFDYPNYNVPTKPIFFNTGIPIENATSSTSSSHLLNSSESASTLATPASHAAANVTPLESLVAAIEIMSDPP